MTIMIKKTKALAARCYAALCRIDYTPLLLIWATAVFYAFFCHYLHLNPVGTSAYSTYTLQALAWRQGRISLGQDYPWLELAVFQGDWYVSFPPVPSIPLYLLSFFCSAQTPDHFLVKLYVLTGCLACYHMLRKAGYDKCGAAGLALLCSFASCLLALTTEGAVWYQAQTLAYALSMLAIMLMYTGHTTLSLFLYALAVGCRPFNALLGLVLFALYYERCKKQNISLRKMLLRALPGIALGLCVACAYGWYNSIRFGNIFEFGHNYLPEFSTQGGKQFALSHVAGNIRTFILGLPFGKTNNGWSLNRFGFSFLLACPVFILMAGWILRDCFRRDFSLLKGVTVACMLIQLFLLLLHRTFGGYQFGARYTCDLLPYAAVYLTAAGRQRRIHAIEIAVLIFAFAFSVYGAAEMLL